MLLDAAALELVVVRPVVSCDPALRTHASSTSHSSSTTVRSRIKLLLVSSTSVNTTQPVLGCRVNMTEDGCA